MFCMHIFLKIEYCEGSHIWVPFCHYARKKFIEARFQNWKVCWCQYYCINSAHNEDATP